MNNAKELPFYKGRYTPVFGFNTKQWWAYDNETDEWCDPPTDVLNDIKNCSNLSEEEYFQNLLDENPDWLYDEGYRYKESKVSDL